MRKLHMVTADDTSARAPWSVTSTAAPPPRPSPAVRPAPESPRWHHTTVYEMNEMGQRACRRRDHRPSRSTVPRAPTHVKDSDGEGRGQGADCVANRFMLNACSGSSAPSQPRSPRALRRTPPAPRSPTAPPPLRARAQRRRPACRPRCSHACGGGAAGGRARPGSASSRRPTLVLPCAAPLLVAVAVVPRAAPVYVSRAPRGVTEACCGRHRADLVRGAGRAPGRRAVACSRRPRSSPAHGFGAVDRDTGVAPSIAALERGGSGVAARTAPRSPPPCGRSPRTPLPGYCARHAGDCGTAAALTTVVAPTFAADGSSRHRPGGARRPRAAVGRSRRRADRPGLGRGAQAAPPTRQDVTQRTLYYAELVDRSP